MIDAALPPPLVPADVDLRDFPGMWVDTDRLLRSDTWILGSSDERAAAFTLWAESWHQVPAASLPSNDRVLAKLSQAEKWKSSREHALRGWVHCNDGRIYHPVVAEKALEAWIKKLASAISGAVGNSKRWNVTIDTTALREQFRKAVECLRDLNPASRVLKEKAVAILMQPSPPESGGESGGDSGAESGGDGRATSGGESGGDRKGPDQTRPTSKKEESAQSVPRPLRAPNDGRTDNPQDGDADPPEANGQSPTQAGAVCKAMRKAGVQAVNPGDPRLLTLLEQGATFAEFEGTASEAAAKGKGFAWVLSVVQARRADAAAIALAPATPKPGEVSGRLPEYVPPPALTAEEKASSDAARKSAMSRLGRVAS